MMAEQEFKRVFEGAVERITHTVVLPGSALGTKDKQTIRLHLQRTQDGMVQVLVGATPGTRMQG